MIHTFTAAAMRNRLLLVLKLSKLAPSRRRVTQESLRVQRAETHGSWRSRRISNFFSLWSVYFVFSVRRHLSTFTNHGLTFTVKTQGFTYPLVGSNKAAILESSCAKEAYDQANGEGNFITSLDLYTGADEKGLETNIRFHCSAAVDAPLRVYEIEQVID